MTIPSPGVVLRAIRPRQWVKNVLLAAAPVAASTLDEWSTLWRTALAILVFVAAAGSTYLFNDTRDLEVDQRHPTKRLRPVAASEMTVAAAHTLASILAAAALAGSFAIRWPFGLVIVGYLLINMSYSFGIKHVPGVELAAIASGFILRAVGGGAATNTHLSVWFLLVICSASLFMVAGKRSAELSRTAGNGGRPVLSRYSVTGLGAVRATTAGLAVVAYAMWVFVQELTARELAFVSTFPFAAALARYAAAIEAGEGEDPEDIILGDGLFQLFGALWAIIYGLAVYG